VAEFLVELYVARSNGRMVARCAARAQAAAEALSHSGTRVRYVSSIFVPEDETCFLLYEADSVDAVETAARNARLTFERVAEAQASGVVKD
jgi:uncharacterized protein DUF4242